MIQISPWVLSTLVLLAILAGFAVGIVLGEAWTNRRDNK